MVLPFSFHNQTPVHISVFNVSFVESISSSFDFTIALIIFGEPLMLRSFSMDNQKEKLPIGSK